MRIPLIAALMLSAPAVWASPPVAPPAKAAKVEPKADAKPAPRRVEPKADAKLVHHVETRKADTAPSTLSLKKKPSHRVMLADWAP